MLLQATTGPRHENGVGGGVAPPQPLNPSAGSVNGISPLEYVPVSRQRSSLPGYRDRRNDSAFPREYVSTFFGPVGFHVHFSIFRSMDFLFILI
jgi:hypothetical protein